MNANHPDVIAVINRLSDRKEAVKKLFQKSRNFQSMCEDYRKCKDAFDYWTQSDKKNAVMSGKEYAALLLELESEIIQQLDENT